MILISFIIGFIATIIGALPPGASNIAVVTARVNGTQKDAMRLIYGAGLGEVMLALTALSFGMVLQEFIYANYWIQYLVVFILALVGLYFILKKNSTEAAKPRNHSRYLVGFMLSFINPPVLVYWVVVFSLLNKWMLVNNVDTYFWTLLLLAGVFFGKMITLLGYSKFGYRIKQKSSNNPSSLNRYIGFILIILAALQLVKLLFN